MTTASFSTPDPRMDWFREARLGMFIHFGLYSLLGRGEWTMNRERIPIAEYETLADRFTIERFDAGELADLAVTLGARYVIFTTKHHEGYCLFDSALTDYTSVKRGPKRDLVREMVDACRERGLRIALYYSLNDWHHQPDAVAALEDPAAHTQYLDYIHGQIRELMSNYGTIDVMWYDGWWPFDAEGWRAEEMNAMVRELQPNILFNNRNCLAGDFATPEQHMTAVQGRVWEANLTLNDNWGYHAFDNNWKSAQQVLQLVLQAARECGNLVLNVGPRGDGAIPEPYSKVFGQVGAWVSANREAVFTTDIPQMDWCNAGCWTAKGTTAYLHVLRWTGSALTLCGLQCKTLNVRFLADGSPIKFEHDGDRLVLSDLPDTPPDPLAAVIALEMDGPPRQYLTGGMRVPCVAHCQYDPVQPNLLALP